MGWFDADREGHEGHLIGLVEDAAGGGLVAEAHMRRLAYPHDDTARAVDALQVGCECGWRSARFHTPPGTMWQPFTVELPADVREAFEAVALELWRRHLADPDPFRVWVEHRNR